MRKDKSLLTYGRHRNRVIVTDAWSSEERKKNIFSTSSELDSSKQSSIFHCSGSENGSLNLSSASSHASYSRRDAGRRAQKTKKAEEKENIGPSEKTGRKTRNARARHDQKNGCSLVSSGSDSSIGSEAGSKPVALRERKKNIDYNDEANLKKQLRGTTAKRKRAVRSVTAVPTNYSINFSDFDDYSLVIAETSDRKNKPGSNSIETSTPVAKRTRCNETSLNKIKASDISHIEVINTPTSDVGYTSIETPQSLRQSQEHNFCSPSLVSSACSTGQNNIARTRKDRIKLTPVSVQLDRLTESFIDCHMSDKRNAKSRDKEQEMVDQSASLFDTPGRKTDDRVCMLTDMLENVSIVEVSESEEESDEIGETGKRKLTHPLRHSDDSCEDEEEISCENEVEVSCEEEEQLSCEEEESDDDIEEVEEEENETEGLSAIHELEECDEGSEEEEEYSVSDCSNDCYILNETNDSDLDDSNEEIGKRKTRNSSRNKEKLSKKAVVNLQRLSESLLSNHVSHREGGRRGKHKQSDEFLESSSIALSSGRNSDSSNCTLYMLADNYHSVSGGSLLRKSSGDLFDGSELPPDSESLLSQPDEPEEGSSKSEEEEQQDLSEDENSPEEESSEEEADGKLPRTPKVLTLRNRTVESLQNSFSEMLTPTKKLGSLVPLSAQTKVLLLCEQSQPISFQEALPGRMLSLCKKIGEGVYGEVFSSKQDGESVAIKIIPIEGDFPVNDEPQKKFDEILPEIVIAKELSDLRYCKSETTFNFCEVKSASIVQGKYPAQLIKQWDVFHKTKGSENDRPDMFPAAQLYVLFVFADCGRDLESYKFESMDQAKSVLTQVTFALAVAEHHLQFEHRDLHWGNILIRPTDEEEIRFKLMGKWFTIPTMGVEANVIDFTLSRLRKDGVTVFSNLATDDTLFEGEGDLQFDVYRNMKKENRNNWERFHPYTNVLWLHYLTDKLVYFKKYPSQASRQGREALRLFRQFLSEILNYHSACEMAVGADFLNS